MRLYTGHHVGFRSHVVVFNWVLPSNHALDYKHNMIYAATTDVLYSIWFLLLGSCLANGSLWASATSHPDIILSGSHILKVHAIRFLKEDHFILVHIEKHVVCCQCLHYSTESLHRISFSQSLRLRQNQYNLKLNEPNRWRQGDGFFRKKKKKKKVLPYITLYLQPN